MFTTPPTATKTPPLPMSDKNPPPPFPHTPAMDPALPETEARLRCANKRRLFRDLRMPTESRWVADWLFTHATHPFHHHTSVPATMFDHALAIRGTHVLHHNGQPCDSAVRPPGIQPGRDLLLVGVAYSGGKLIGYTFGGVEQGEAAGGAAQMCEGGPFNARDTAWVPHFVGRFAFDGAKQELLMVVNRANEQVTAIVSMKRGDGRVRERSVYAVMNGSYGFRRLPGRLAGMATFAERRLAAIAKYQFAVGGRETGGGSGVGGRGTVSTDLRVLCGELAKVERLVKGRFFSPRLCMDSMDVESGELMRRETAQVEGRFDVMDAVVMRVFRDRAMRAYYTYKASLRQGAAGASEVSRVG